MHHEAFKQAGLLMETLFPVILQGGRAEEILYAVACSSRPIRALHPTPAPPEAGPYPRALQERRKTIPSLRCRHFLEQRPAKGTPHRPSPQRTRGAANHEIPGGPPSAATARANPQRQVKMSGGKGRGAAERFFRSGVSVWRLCLTLEFSLFVAVGRSPDKNKTTRIPREASAPMGNMEYRQIPPRNYTSFHVPLRTITVPGKRGPRETSAPTVQWMG